MLSRLGQCKSEMHKHSTWLGKFDYNKEADILEVFFSEQLATNAAEIHEDIVLRYNHNTREAVSLILNNYAYLTEPDLFGPRTFQLQLNSLNSRQRQLVETLLRSYPVKQIIRTFSYAHPDNVHVLPLALIDPLPVPA